MIFKKIKSLFIQIENECMSKILFNSLINERTKKDVKTSPNENVT